MIVITEITDREMLIEHLRSLQLSRKKGEGGLSWPGPPQLPVHRSQWKFIFPIGHISFRIRLDSMLKLIRNYINPIGFAVWIWSSPILTTHWLISWVQTAEELEEAALDLLRRLASEGVVYAEIRFCPVLHTRYIFLPRGDFLHSSLPCKQNIAVILWQAVILLNFTFAQKTPNRTNAVF